MRGALRPQARRAHRQGRPGGERHTPQAGQALRALPQGGRREGEQGGRGGPPPGGVVGQEHRALPEGGPLHRLAGEEALRGGRRRGTPGQARRSSQGRGQGGPEGHERGQKDAGEPRARRVPGTSRPRADRHTLEPTHRREDPRRQPRGRGIGKAIEGSQREAGDAFRGFLPPRILDLGRALLKPLHPRNGSGLRGGDPGKLLARHTGERGDALPGHERLPLGTA